MRTPNNPIVDVGVLEESTVSEDRPDAALAYHRAYQDEVDEKILENDRPLEQWRERCPDLNMAICCRGVPLGVTRRCIRPIATMMPGRHTSTARRIEPCLERGTQGRCFQQKWGYFEHR